MSKAPRHGISAKNIAHHECHKPPDVHIIRILPRALDKQSVCKLPVSGYVVFECLVVILRKRIVTKSMLSMILKFVKIDRHLPKQSRSAGGILLKKWYLAVR